MTEHRKRLEELAGNDAAHWGTPGLPCVDVRAADLRAILADLDKANRRAANLQMQAESWAMEARGHKATVHEAYQAVTGATGEPGNWNGAEPIKAAIADRDAAQAKLAEAVEVINAFIEQEVSYMTINKLGDPEKQHNVKWARAFLSSLEPDAKSMEADNG